MILFYNVVVDKDIEGFENIYLDQVRDFFVNEFIWVVVSVSSYFFFYYRFKLIFVVLQMNGIIIFWEYFFKIKVFVFKGKVKYYIENLKLLLYKEYDVLGYIMYNKLVGVFYVDYGQYV